MSKQFKSFRNAEPKPLLQINPTALPGQMEHLLLHNKFIAGDPRNSIPVQGGPGLYRVIYTFARPGYAPIKEREFSFDEALPGDSHLAIAHPALAVPPGSDKLVSIEFQSQNDDGVTEFVGYPNTKGYLGRMVTTIPAKGFRDASIKAYRAIAPSLSNWAVHLDAPMWIWRTFIQSVETESIEIQMRSSFANVPLATNSTGTMCKEFRAFASLYREGIGSSNPAYEFLCLYKISEGIRRRRDRITAEVLAKGETPSRPVERVPKDQVEFGPWLNTLFMVKAIEWDELALASVFIPDVVGRKSNDILDKELRSLRDDIAHALFNEAGRASLDVDEAEHLYRIQRWLPIMKCIARQMLKNEFPDQFLVVPSHAV